MSTSFLFILFAKIAYITSLWKAIALPEPVNFLLYRSYIINYQVAF
nr:MAG TPA: hypothetical protein [Caudoviricetes sp.]